MNKDRIDLNPKGLDKIPGNKTEIPKELQPVDLPAEPKIARLNYKDALNIVIAVLREKALNLLDKSTFNIGSTIMKGTLKDRVSNYLAVLMVIITAVQAYFEAVGDQPFDWVQLLIQVVVVVVLYLTGKDGNIKPKIQPLQSSMGNISKHPTSTVAPKPKRE